jgi:hypothetical protein
MNRPEAINFVLYILRSRLGLLSPDYKVAMTLIGEHSITAQELLEGARVVVRGNS